jgi:hypothetical protein
MKSIIDYAVKYRITNGKNLILNKSLDSEIKEDKVIKILTKEVAEFTRDLLNLKDKKKLKT